MKSQLPAGDQIHPVTREEAASLSSGLLTMIEKNPGLGEQPLMVLLTRLLLGVTGQRTLAVIPQIASQEMPDKQPLTELTEANEKLRSKVKELEDRVEDLQGELDDANMAIMSKPDEQEMLRLTAEAERLGGKLRDAEGLVRTCEDQIARLGRDLKAASDRETLLKTQLKGAETKQEALWRDFEAATAKANTQDALVKKIKEIEWSSKHPSFTWSRTGAKIACCPVCQGLEPNASPHRETGHRNGCALQKVIKLI
jgi:TolA-binding protein